jgi:membrane protein implicated in regulation of membrane protease activity
MTRPPRPYRTEAAALATMGLILGALAAWYGAHSRGLDLASCIAVGAVAAVMVLVAWSLWTRRSRRDDKDQRQ